MSGDDAGARDVDNHHVYFCKRLDPYGEPVLILSRRVGESIMIGDEIAVTVLGIKGSQVRLGVSAPRDIGVHRREIYDRIQKELAAESKTGTDPD